jgi:hypothetical protein
MASKTYRLKIVQEGREFEAEGDKAFVFDMLKQFGPPVPVSIGPAAGLANQKSSKKRAVLDGTSMGKSVSIREFIQQLDLKKHTDITLAFGFYLEKYQGVSEFSAADVNNCYYEAKLEASNTSQMFILNIKRGYLMASKKNNEKKGNRYTLTGSGEKFIESNLQHGS